MSHDPSTLGPGIHEISAEAYHADPCERPSLSASIASLIANRSPRHAWHAHPRLNPAYEREDKSTYALGTVLHELLLQGSTDCLEVIDAKDFRTNDARDARDAARAAGKVPLLAKDVTRLTEMVDAVHDQLECRDDDPPILAGGKPEQTIVWEENGVTCRARVDWLHDSYLAIDDAKTTSGSADPRRWSRGTLWDIGADIQVAFNRRGVKAVTNVEPAFRYVLIENHPPYVLSVVELSASALDLGQRKAELAIARWRECLETEFWPGYQQQDVHFAETPPWEEERFLYSAAEAVAA